ncbi:MAG: ECF transporter S component [Nitrososphaerota archaeon]
MLKYGDKTSLRIIRLVLSTTLVTVATIIFTIYVPATRGYFNLGETMVYFTALYFGPFIGAFAGGVGSALADLLLGYIHYAPATLLIKAGEGWVAGYLAQKFIYREKTTMIFLLSLLVSFIYLGLLLMIGATVLSGEAEVYLTTFMIFGGYLDPAIWYFIGVLALATPIYLALRSRRSEGLLILILMIAGAVMVSGYFLYEQFLLGYYALAEVPINLAQVYLGIAVAVPLYKAVENITSKHVKPQKLVQ